MTSSAVKKVVSVLIILTSLWTGFSFAGEPVRLEISLRKVEEDALRFSPRLKAAEEEFAAARNRTNVQASYLWPRISFDGSWREVSEVAKMTVGGKSIYLGDNLNYSIGPSLNWTVWDQGAIVRQRQSLKALERAKEEEIQSLRRQVLLAVRLAYFQVQMAAEQERLVFDSLKLALAQYNDIENRRRAGTSNKIDSLSAHQEVLNRQRQFRQAQTDFAVALRDLFSLTGQSDVVDVSLPLDMRIEGDLPESIEQPTVRVNMDLLENCAVYLTPLSGGKFDVIHPSIQIYNRMAEASHLAAKSIESGNWPKVQLTAKTSVDYPNGPMLESFNQNMVGVTASIPLFEGKRVPEQTAEQNRQARASVERRNQVQTDLQSDWRKAQDILAGLRVQRDLNIQSVKETEDLARLVYSSYKAGSSSYLEIQSANVRALESKIQAVRTEIQILMQMAVLANLSSGD